MTLPTVRTVFAVVKKVTGLCRKSASPVVGPRSVDAILGQFTAIERELDEASKAQNEKAIRLYHKAAAASKDADRAARVASRLRNLLEG